MPIIGANLGASLAQGIAGLRLDPYLSCNFVVEIEGILSGGFASCSGLEVEIEAYPYRAGGVNDFVYQFPGAVRHPPLVFKRGLSPIDGLWNWHQRVAAGNAERHNGTIYLLDRAIQGQVVPVMWWNFTKALPLKWTGPELDAKTAAVAFESVQLVHQGIARPTLANAPGDIAGEFGVNLGNADTFF
jgi:phage tail-like protein